MFFVWGITGNVIVAGNITKTPVLRHAMALLLIGTCGVSGCAAPASRQASSTTPTATASPATATAGSDRYARGAEVLGRLDPTAPRRVVDACAKVSPDFGRYVIEYPFGDIYARPGLDTRTRLLAAIAALTAVGDTGVPLGHHVRYALNAGCTREQVVETIMQTSVYAGFPRAVAGLAVAEEAFKEHGQARQKR